MNLRYDEKGAVDVVHAWWSARTGRNLTQPDVMSRILELAFENPRADLPPGFAEVFSAQRDVDDPDPPR